MSKNPTVTQEQIMRRVARSGWDCVVGAELRSASRSPFLHVEEDYEAGDGRMIARLTDEGAAWLDVREIKLIKEPDGSWVMDDSFVHHPKVQAQIEDSLNERWTQEQVEWAWATLPDLEDFE